MSNDLLFIAKRRNRVGKGASRLTRREGDVPAIIYGDNTDPTPIYIEKKIVLKHIQNPALYTNIYTVDIEGRKEEVLVREVQLHPLRSVDPTHINFLRVGANTVTRIEIPLVFINHAKSPGLKLGGTLNIVSHTLEVRCNPKNAPKSIEIDLGEAKIGTVIKVEDISLPEGVKTYLDKGFALASITSQAEEGPASNVDTATAATPAAKTAPAAKK